MAFGDNANDTYTETETISYGSRISSSFKGMLPGILMFLGAFPLLFWNEGRAVKTARASATSTARPLPARATGTRWTSPWSPAVTTLSA